MIITTIKKDYEDLEIIVEGGSQEEIIEHYTGSTFYSADELYPAEWIKDHPPYIGNMVDDLEQFNLDKNGICTEPIYPGLYLQNIHPKYFNGQIFVFVN